jgi:hypothetical protein
MEDAMQVKQLYQMQIDDSDAERMVKKCKMANSTSDDVKSSPTRLSVQLNDFIKAHYLKETLGIHSFG